jgi:hypothetical protein
LDQDFLTLEFMQVVEGVELGQVQEEILLQELVEQEEVEQVQVEPLMQLQQLPIQVVEVVGLVLMVLQQVVMVEPAVRESLS